MVFRNDGELVSCQLQYQENHVADDSQFQINANDEKNSLSAEMMAN